MDLKVGYSLRELAPTGRLRAALNLANTVLVRRDGNDRPVGITVDLAQELARRVGLGLDLELFDKGGDVADVVGAEWDICFLAADPQRLAEISFTPPYLRIEGRFLVKSDSPAKTLGDFDRLALSVAAVRGSAYSLYLLRSIGVPRVRLFESKQEARLAFDAGVAHAMVTMGSGSSVIDSSARLIEPPFMSVSQAIGVPADRPAAASFVAATLHQMTADNFVSSVLQKHGIQQSK